MAGHAAQGPAYQLEKILDLRHILLVPVFRPGEIPSPLRRTPDFQAVIHSHEEDFLIFIHRDELTKTHSLAEYIQSVCSVFFTNMT